MYSYDHRKVAINPELQEKAEALLAKHDGWFTCFPRNHRAEPHNHIAVEVRGSNLRSLQWAKTACNIRCDQPTELQVLDTGKRVHSDCKRCVAAARKRTATSHPGIKEEISDRLEKDIRSWTHFRWSGFNHSPSNSIRLQFQSLDLPKHPPDDDGEEDAAYWEEVESIRAKTEQWIQKELEGYRKYVRSVSVRFTEKGTFHLDLKLR